MKIDDIHEMAHDINNYVNEHHMLKSLNQQLFDENERLNSIIDEAIDYIKKHDIRQDKCLHLFIFEKKELLEILGEKENE